MKFKSKLYKLKTKDKAFLIDTGFKGDKEFMVNVGYAGDKAFPIAVEPVTYPSFYKPKPVVAVTKESKIKSMLKSVNSKESNTSTVMKLVEENLRLKSEIFDLKLEIVRLRNKQDIKDLEDELNKMIDGGN